MPAIDNAKVMNFKIRPRKVLSSPKLIKNPVAGFSNIILSAQATEGIANATNKAHIYFNFLIIVILLIILQIKLRLL